MKKRHIVLICIGALLLLITILIVVKVTVDNQKYNISGEIKSVEVESSLDSAIGGPIKTSEKEYISVLLNCIKDVKQNNKKRIKNIEQAPTFYEITFYFANGKNQTYKYTVYPATECNDPFGAFYALFLDK